MRWDRGTELPEPASEPDLIGDYDAAAEPSRVSERRSGRL